MQPATGGRNRGAKALLVSALLLGCVILLSRQWWTPSPGKPPNSQTQSNKTVPPVAGGDSRPLVIEAGASDAHDRPEPVPVQKPDYPQDSNGLQTNNPEDTVQKRSGLPPPLSSNSEMYERQIKGLTFDGSAPEHLDVLRRAWRAGDGKFYDRKLLHQSIEQVNQLGLYEPLSEDDCEVIMRPDGHIHIRVRLRPLGNGNP